KIQPAGTTVNPATDSFICGTRACQKCGTSKILEPTIAACNTQANIFCESKPMVAEDAMGCPVLSCDGTNMLYILMDSTTSMAVANPMDITCDQG
ncbi:hypothetical protein PENTCL1PPCAC_28022, partial [Pristionchus entomophagus]